ncbi:DUF4398 domain-containing protein [Alcanivorax sp. JB21]|uniref:DUF4398 domain-containing protein n=1 Tax=Alcanivorax limicola TaxID=2874102 RepID=UPI001CBA88FA|nr:DUF4398 domain-containing protein [Alcanivorax limicola]MBZ2190555.1 DUF4398 domain-containing protein [Alcanivorax limicola]
MSAGLAVILAILVGCASTPEPPTGSLTSAREAIASAEQSDARQHAGAELDEAKQKLMQAEKAVESEDMLDAERLAQQARVVAELAIARTATAKASQVNRQLHQDADALNEELQRMGGQQ